MEWLGKKLAIKRAERLAKLEAAAERGRSPPQVDALPAGVSMSRLILALLVLLASAGLLAQGKSPQAKGKPSKPPAVWTPYPNPGWVLEYSTGTTLKFTPTGEPYFTFPSQPSKSANMLDRDWQGAFPGATEIVFTVRVATTGYPVFQLAQGPEACTNPPAARIWIASRYWQNANNRPTYDYDRWWSRVGFLALGGAGTFTFSAPLDPASWGGLWGYGADEYPDDFYRSCRKPTAGLGWCSAVAAPTVTGSTSTGGTATFTVLGYEIR